MLYFFVYAAFSLSAIFYLPYLVPQHPTTSDSYLFGYNNRAGLLLLLLLVAIGSVWTRGLKFQFNTSGASQPVPKKTLLVTLLAALAGCVAMYIVAGRFTGFIESSYEIDRIWLLSQGKIPYVDFEWPFGYALLYVPLFLSRVLSIGIVQAYYLSWIMSCLLGILLLFAAINRVDYPTQHKQTIYLLLYGAWFLSILNMGTHYTLTRYTCPLYFVLVVQKRIKGATVMSPLYGALLSIVFTIVLLLISPETAIAYAFACVCIFLFSTLSWKGQNVAVFSGMMLGLGAVFLTALKLHVLDTVKASGGGADSFPISFSLYVLLFFAAIFLCACYLYRRFRDPRINDNTFGLIVYSVPMLAAALGRCDSLHIYHNGLGIFLASMLYVSNYRAMWKWYRGAFFVVMILLSSASLIWFFRLPLTRCVINIPSASGINPRVKSVVVHLARTYVAIVDFSNPAKRAEWEKVLEYPQHPALQETVDLSVIYPTWHGTYLAPMGYKPDGFGSYLSKQVDYGRFEGFENSNTTEAAQKILAEIKDHPEKALLLPDHFEKACQSNSRKERREMSILFAFPYFGKAVHPDSVREPICAYILKNYRLEQEPTMQSFWYGLWLVKPAGE
jgi:hypothetical protein